MAYCGSILPSSSFRSDHRLEGYDNDISSYSLAIAIAILQPRTQSLLQHRTEQFPINLDSDTSIIVVDLGEANVTSSDCQTMHPEDKLYQAFGDRLLGNA